ncbi:enoyl-CoA hydratase/isomerase family protein [Mariniluteicoccus endophyticus]
MTIDALPLAPGPTGTDEVLFAVADNVGHIVLNRPKAINSLSTAMCRAVSERLAAWADDDEVAVVLLRGAGQRGLCAGGDVKAVRQALVDDPASAAPEEFFTTEYAMNADIAAFAKPYVAHMDGVCMGGGLGISAHGSHRLVTAGSKIAMPETIIGFFPDVGMLHLLARAPGETGALLALTGRTVSGLEAIAAGLADAESDDPEAYAATLASGVEPQPANQPAPTRDAWVDECFAADSAAEILDRLRGHDAPAAREAADQVAQRSPLSVAVTLAALRRAETMTLDEVLAQDRVMAARFCRDSDFAEGVRCQLVDRGDTPRWKHRSVADVTDAEVAAFFG